MIVQMINVVMRRSWREPNSPVMSGPFAMLIPMGTLEATKHKPWTWILGAPLSALKEAGVQFDPEARGLKAIQGDADSGSALEARAHQSSPQICIYNVGCAAREMTCS